MWTSRRTRQRRTRSFDQSVGPNLGGDLRRHGEDLLHLELEAVQGDLNEEDGSENFEMGLRISWLMLGLRKAGQLAATDW